MIRRFENRDIMKCAEIMQSVYNNEYWRCSWSFDTARAYLQDIVDSKKFVGFTSLECDEIIGAALCREKVWWNGNEMYIEEMFVTPSFQGQGYGRQLLCAVKEYVRKNQLEGITLSTYRASPAPAFYKKNGFANNEHALLMYYVDE